jgi:hypothetical protein
VIFAAVLAAVQIVAIAPALANAANPSPDTAATAQVNADGTVTVKVSGTWVWPGQSCEGRYGEGWAVDWWGISSSSAPANPFSLTDATMVTSPTATTTGTITPAGSIPIKGDGFFHVSADYNGQDINSPTTCTDTGSGGSAGSTGSWSAMATYPNQSDLPPAICVNMYDEHGSEGKPSGSANDFSAVNDHDNSIQTNAFNPSVGSGYCATPTVVPPPQPGISLNKQICNVTATKCSKSMNSQWVKAHEIPSGSTAVWRLTITNTGNTSLSGITVADQLAPGCAGPTTPSSLGTGGTIVFTCNSMKVTKGFTNVAKVTGAPPSGASVSATSSATVTVKKPSTHLITSQTLLPNDEAFIRQEATGHVTFSLYPPSNPTCTGTPAYTSTVKVGSNGAAETANYTVVATAPGTWRWFVSYTGNDGHMTSPCGAEKFSLSNGTSAAGNAPPTVFRQRMHLTASRTHLTTSQTLTPNDEAFIRQEATGHVTFSLYPPGNRTCTGTPAYTSTVTVANGTAETDNFNFVSTKPGTWRWFVSYTGNDGHLTSGCGVEKFTITNG